MNSNWLALYHRLPAFAQFWAASLYGARLERWRYGPETERLVEDALARETWTAERWDAWRGERLADVLDRAATCVPYYAEYWAARRIRGDRGSWLELRNWPVLEKEKVRRQPRAFIAEDCRRLCRSATSGTTGTPIQLWHTRRFLLAWYALFEARWRRWYGVSHGDRWAILGGQPVVHPHRRRPPFWVWNSAMRQLYISANHLSAQSAPHIAGAIAGYGARYLYGYPSAVYVLAAMALRGGVAAPKLAAVITNAEPLYAHQRETITAFFDCPVRETYGMSELVAAAGECERGSLHLWPEAGLLEDAGGITLATSLLNTDTPLIRYRVGDTVKMGTRQCPCGRTLPVIDSVDGRSDDMLVTPDGRVVGRLDGAFKTARGILEAQVVQETADRVRLRVVPAPDYTASAGEAMAAELRRRLGCVRVEIDAVPSIARGPNGKFRAVVSELPR